MGEGLDFSGGDSDAIWLHTLLACRPVIVISLGQLVMSMAREISYSWHCSSSRQHLQNFAGIVGALLVDTVLHVLPGLVKLLNVQCCQAVFSSLLML